MPSVNPRQFGEQVSFDDGLRDVTNPQLARANKLAMRNAMANVPIDWAGAEVRPVDPTTLRATQPWLHAERLEFQRKHPDLAAPVKVIESNGHRYVKDGHHRAQVAAERGEPM